MRKKYPFHVCILFFIFCASTMAAVPSIGEILKTDQYVLVTYYGGVTSAESNVPPGACPLLMLRPTTKRRDHGDYVGFHLIRDPNGRIPPRYMSVVSYAGILEINLYDINMTEVFTSSRKTVSNSDLVMRNSMSTFRPVNSLFDSTTRHLFVDFSTIDRIIYKQYYIHGLFTSNAYPRFVRDIEKTSPRSRFDWAEDHYAGKFYYKEKVDNEIGLFEIPMTSFVPTVSEGEPGIRVGTLNEKGSFHGANGGALYTVSRKEVNGESTLFASLVPTDLGAGLQCKIARKPSEVPERFSFIVIRGNDFCMLRDGPEYNKKSCEAEQREFMASHGYNNDDSSDAIKWLLVACLVMFMIIVLLFVYIYWLRSTFISDDERDHANERFQYETEASLFVSKQRSFPSAYQDPALLDVSVDKWN